MIKAVLKEKVEIGFRLPKFHTMEEIDSGKIEEIGNQLYNTSTVIYGYVDTAAEIETLIAQLAGINIPPLASNQVVEGNEDNLSEITLLGSDFDGDCCCRDGGWHASGRVNPYHCLPHYPGGNREVLDGRPQNHDYIRKKQGSFFSYP